MSSQVQNLPTGGGHQDQVSSTSRDTAAQQTSEARQANNAGATTATASSPPPPPPPPPQPAYGQQQQAPYVPYAGHSSQPYTTPIRPLPEQSRLYIAAKLGLTALSIVWSIVIVAITSVLLNTGVSGAVVALYTYVIVAASILWNAAELITYCVRVRRQTNRAIHPGAHVGLHLIFWLVGAFAILLTVGAYQGESYVVESCERSNQDDDRDSYRYSGYNYCDDYYQYEDYRSVLSLLRALLAIFVIWTLNHFILFVLACTDTHKRNSMRPAAFVVPIAAMPAQGMYYPQQQQASAQPMQQYYPYPVMMQPPAVANGTQPAQPAQNFAGFYAPSAPGTSTQAPN